ncbi:hypothetical protein TOTORO_03020 [Serratia phage vB_SmaS-Totoro]|nr:hypothetical protein TOTORO_03020 [Serratia phage vB_SmaS-Totoro]
MPVSTKSRNKVKKVTKTSARKEVFDTIESIRQKLVDVYKLMAYYTSLKTEGKIPEDKVEEFSGAIHTIGPLFNTFATNLAKFKTSLEALPPGTDFSQYKLNVIEFVNKLPAVLEPLAICSDIVLSTEDKEPTE